MAAPINDYSTNPDYVASMTADPRQGEPAPPTKVDTVPQQGSTAPGDGHQVHAGDVGATHAKERDPNTAGEVSFKERVIGAAQKTRGTVLGNQELKAHGEAILEGRTTHEQERKEH